ncbi:MAG TPA: hypothetical protein VF158_10800 [Longimicrobiales bacterium]
MIGVVLGGAVATTLIFVLLLCRAAADGSRLAERLACAGSLSVDADPEPSIEPAPDTVEIRHAHMSIALAEAREAVVSGARGQVLYALETAIEALQYARQIDADHPTTREVA